MKSKKFPVPPSGAAVELAKEAIRLLFGGQPNAIADLRMKVELLRSDDRVSLRRVYGRMVLAGSYPLDAFGLLFGDRAKSEIAAVARLATELKFPALNYDVYNLIPLWEQAHAYRDNRPWLRDDERILRALIRREGSKGQIRILKTRFDAEWVARIEQKLVRRILKPPSRDEKRAAKAELTSRIQVAWQEVQDAERVLAEMPAVRDMIPVHESESQHQIELLDKQIDEVRERRGLLKERIDVLGNDFPGQRLKHERENDLLERKLRDLQDERREWSEWGKCAARQLRSLQCQLITHYGSAVAELVINRRLQKPVQQRRGR